MTDQPIDVDCRSLPKVVAGVGAASVTVIGPVGGQPQRTARPPGAANHPAGSARGRSRPTAHGHRELTLSPVDDMYGHVPLQSSSWPRHLRALDPHGSGSDDSERRLPEDLLNVRRRPWIPAGRGGKVAVMDEIPYVPLLVGAAALLVGPVRRRAASVAAATTRAAAGIVATTVAGAVDIGAAAVRGDTARQAAHD